MSEASVSTKMRFPVTPEARLDSRYNAVLAISSCLILRAKGTVFARHCRIGARLWLLPLPQARFFLSFLFMVYYLQTGQCGIDFSGHVGITKVLKHILGTDIIGYGLAFVLSAFMHHAP